MSEMFVCSICHGEHPAESCTCFNGQSLCPTCLSERTCVCDHCGDRIWLEDAQCDEYQSLCQHCADTYYESCAGCGRLVLSDDLHYLSENSYNGYCESCYNRRTHGSGIQSYCYKPSPIFYGAGPRYLGVELEIDNGGESDGNANLILEVANTDHSHIYIKHDGSLHDGMEIVTHPMTIGYHRYEMPWREIIQKALELDYTSHKPGTCGLHVHVNRDSLGDDYQEQENTIARILFLVENFWHELLRFSRRTQKQMDDWASRYGRKDDPKEVLHHAKQSGDRYTCVNLTPSETIEFRMFRGTLKYNTLIATLQMVERLCDVAFHLSDDEIKTVTWNEFVAGLSEGITPELVQYLKERRLYVNEPVDAAEEV